MSKQQLRWPESDLDLGRDTRGTETEDVARAVVTGHGGDSGVHVREVEGLLHSAKLPPDQ
jgi:hypothetical protein